MHPYYNVIRDAILNKKQIIAVYDGHKRELCPHKLGRKGNRYQCLFYQFGGSSGSCPIEPTGSPRNWRCIPIEDMVIIAVTDGAWHTAFNHSRPSTCIDIVDVEVDYKMAG